MIHLLNGVTVLLLTALIACDILLSSCSMNPDEECQGDLTVKCVQDYLIQVQQSTGPGTFMDDYDDDGPLVGASYLMMSDNLQGNAIPPVMAHKEQLDAMPPAIAYKEEIVAMPPAMAYEEQLVAMPPAMAYEELVAMPPAMAYKEELGARQMKRVKSYLNTIMNLMARLINDATDQSNLTSIGKDLLNANEKLMTALVKDTDTYSNISFSVQNLEAQVFTIGPTFNLRGIPALITSHAAMDIDLVGISKSNKGSAAVAFMTYTNMADIFTPNFYNILIDSQKTLMSAVVSVSLPNTYYTELSKPVNFTLKHIKELSPEAVLSCMGWGMHTGPSCYITQTNSTHTVCSCYNITAFALISETDPCMSGLTEYCPLYFLFLLSENIPEELPQETVENYLTTTMSLTARVKKEFVSKFYGFILLYVNERLTSKLVKETNSHKSISISLQTLEVEVFMVGPNVTLSETPRLDASHASLDIDLIELSKNKDGSAAVTFMSYTTVADRLEPSFYIVDDSNKTIMSTVVTVNLLKTPYQNFIKPANFTLKHINDITTHPEGILSCVLWDWYEWDTSLCIVTQTNSTHTVCSCNEPGALALFMLTISCRDHLTAECTKNFLDQIHKNTIQGLPQELVERYLNIIKNLTTNVKEADFEKNDLISFGNGVLEVNAKLVSTLVEKTDTYMLMNISFQTIEVQVFAVGPNVTFNKIPTIITSHASLDIDLIGISKNNKESASVSFICYHNMSDILKPIFFNTIIQTKKTVMSSVVSVSLPQTTSKNLIRPVNITLKHINELEPEFSLSCVFWNETEWVEDGCDVIQTNSSHTVCSCNRLATFVLIMETDPCRVTSTEPCTRNFLTQIEDNTAQELPKQVVDRYLNITMNLMSRVKGNTNEQNNLMYYGKAVLDLNEKLVSTLVKETDTYNTTSISLPNLEVQVFVVDEPNASFIPQLSISNASLDIDLIGLSKNNKGSAAVAFMSYSNVADILKPTFFNTAANTRKTLMSTVVSVTLPKTTNTHLSKPVKLIFKHISALDPEGSLSCVSWKGREWVKDGCGVTQTNSTHTVCSCDHLSVFALIMEIIPCKTLFGATVSLHCNHVLNMSMAKAVGVVFLTLCLLTFSFYCQNKRETNTALINLSLNLLLFHLIDLLKTLFQTHLQPPQACAVMIGIRWFFFISAFVWMLIETVLLFLVVKNLSKMTLNQREVHSLKWLYMIGYLIPLAVVIVCTLVYPQNSFNEDCWETQDTNMNIFDIPILFIVASNVILYFIIIIIMIFTLKRLRNESLQRRNTDDKDLILNVMFKSLAQFIILGCYWILLYIPNENGVLYNTFLFLNSQQGTFIFLVHCLLNQQVRQQYSTLMCAFCSFKKSGTTTEVKESQETQL